jgi:putative chitinase
MKIEIDIESIRAQLVLAGWTPPALVTKPVSLPKKAEFLTPLRHWQWSKDLKQDGIMGPKTIAMLCEVYGISKSKIGLFLGQCHHESAGFTRNRENMNYSAGQLMRIFPKRFKQDELEKFANKPVDMANRVYANRNGNGSEATGDGWNYRGAGALQLTGRANIVGYFNSLGIIANPDALGHYGHYFKSAVWYFNERKLWELDVVELSKAINLGSPTSAAKPNGLDDRIKWTKHYTELASKI